MNGKQEKKERKWIENEGNLRLTKNENENDSEIKKMENKTKKRTRKKMKRGSQKEYRKKYEKKRKMIIITKTNKIKSYEREERTKIKKNDKRKLQNLM